MIKNVSTSLCIIFDFATTQMSLDYSIKVIEVEAYVRLFKLLEEHNMTPYYYVTLCGSIFKILLY